MTHNELLAAYYAACTEEIGLKEMLKPVETTKEFLKKQLIELGSTKTKDYISIVEHITRVSIKSLPEVEKIIPELVGYEEDGITPRTVKYEEIISILIQGMKEQQKQIDVLKQEIQWLKR